jgi:hypothetical protein
MPVVMVNWGGVCEFPSRLRLAGWCGGEWLSPTRGHWNWPDPPAMIADPVDP